MERKRATFCNFKKSLHSYFSKSVKFQYQIPGILSKSNFEEATNDISKKKNETEGSRTLSEMRKQKTK